MPKVTIPGGLVV